MPVGEQGIVPSKAGLIGFILGAVVVIMWARWTAQQEAEAEHIATHRTRGDCD